MSDVPAGLDVQETLDGLVVRIPQHRAIEAPPGLRFYGLVAAVFATVVTTLQLPSVADGFLPLFGALCGFVVLLFAGVGLESLTTRRWTEVSLTPHLLRVRELVGEVPTSSWQSPAWATQVAAQPPTAKEVLIDTPARLREVDMDLLTPAQRKWVVDTVRKRVEAASDRRGDVPEELSAMVEVDDVDDIDVVQLRARARRKRGSGVIGTLLSPLLLPLLLPALYVAGSEGVVFAASFAVVVAAGLLYGVLANMIAADPPPHVEVVRYGDGELWIGDKKVDPTLVTADAGWLMAGIGMHIDMTDGRADPAAMEWVEARLQASESPLETPHVGRRPEAPVLEQR